MASLHEELKQQREQIKKHLDWLDHRIAELSKSEVAKGSEKNAAPPPTQSDPVAKPPEEAKNKAVPYLPDPDAPAYKEKNQGELRRAQFGCLALFILSTALFLFLLFGLPYLLPEKAEEPENEMIEGVILDGMAEEESLDELMEETSANDPKEADLPNESEKD